MTDIGLIGFKDGYLYRAWRYWLPPLIAGGLAWIAFLVSGETPILRASALALVIVGMGFILRRLGAVLAIAGALALAATPSFWVQTGGAESLNTLAVLTAGVGSLLAAGLGVLILPRLAGHTRIENRTLLIGAGVALAVFGMIFLLVVGQPRSLRLTTLATVWALFLLIDGLFVSNPRPDSPPTGQLDLHHTYGLLIVMGIGIFNDPLFVLLGPAVLLGLFLTNHRLHPLYWIGLVSLLIYGLAALVATYGATDWWMTPAALVEMQGLQVPYLIGDAWREPSRWIKLIDLVVNQFTPVGLVLGVLGLARLARWYPPVGVVTMIAYGTFVAFGLLYFGADSSTVLLPLLMIQLIWMTYAVYAFAQWTHKMLKRQR